MKYISVLILLLTCIICRGQDCDKLVSTFQSYTNALNTISKTRFKISESANTSSSSWIRSAKYFSCGGSTGFLIIEANSQNYIHQNVPFNIWNSFKNSPSFGQYYNKFIKNRYRLYLK